MRPFGFLDGVRIFIRAFARVWVEPDLRRWYFRTLALTFLIAGALVVGLFAFGSWAFASYFENAWSTTVAVLLWVLVLFYIGGQLATLLRSSLVLLVGGESALTRVYFRDLVAPPSDKARESIRIKFQDHSREIMAMLKSVLVACLAWPLFLLPFLMPLGVLAFAWAMAGDALAVGRRLCHERGFEALEDGREITSGARMGMAIMPSSLALFPVLGWVLLPILQVAGLEMQLASQIRIQDELQLKRS